MSERIFTNDRAFSEQCRNLDDECKAICENGVRQPSGHTPPPPRPSQGNLPPAHPSNRLLAQLNANWRIVDDPLQWILQRRQGNPRKKNSGWQDRSFCTTREGLSRCIHEYCGEVDPASLARISALPPNHSMQNLDVHKTDQDQIDSVSDPLSSGHLTVHGVGDRDPRSSSTALY